MKKTLRPLLILLLSLAVLLVTTASAWAAPGGMHGRWFYGGRSNRFSMNFYVKNGNQNNGNQNNGNQNWGDQNWGDQNWGDHNNGNQVQQSNQNYDDNENGTMPFTDVPGWAKKQVAQMYGMGIIKGIGNGLFGSNQTLTRAQFAVLLDREFGLSTSQSNTVTFSDVPTNSYYYPYIEAAAPYLDYWNGSNGTYLFHPTDPATREDVIASMVVAAGLANQTPDTSVLSKFADAGSISPNLTNLVAIAVQKGLVTGSQNQSGTWYLDPQQPLTRAEAATLLYRALGYSKVAPGGITVQNGTSDTVQLSASSSVAALDQSVEITATVLNSSGQVLNNVPVAFSVNGSATLGSGTVDTNSSGIAQTTLYDGTAEYVTVTASAAGVSASTTVQFGTATTAGSIELTYTPQTVYTGQTATVSATVLNSSGQAMNDVPVTFTVNGSAILGSGTAYTNSGGIAQTTVTDATAQTVTVTASATGVSSSTTVQFSATTTAGSIELTYTPQTVYTGQTATVSATVLNSSGQAMNDVPVTFTVSGSAILGSGTVYTNSGGIAQTTVTDATAQTVTVTASATGVSSSTSVQFSAATTAAGIELSYTPQPAYTGQQETLSATVLNSSNQALNGVPVTFSVNGAATLGSGTVYTNSNGIAQTTLADTTAQTVTVTASGAGVSTSASVQFNAAAVVGSIVLTYTPLPATVGQQATVTAAVYNASGQPLNNVPVTFSVNGAASLGSGTVDTNSSGIAQTTLYDGTAQTVTVYAKTQGFNASTTVQFTAD